MTFEDVSILIVQYVSIIELLLLPGPFSKMPHKHDLTEFNNESQQNNRKKNGKFLLFPFPLLAAVNFTKRIEQYTER